MTDFCDIFGFDEALSQELQAEHLDVQHILPWRAMGFRMGIGFELAQAWQKHCPNRLEFDRVR